MYMYMENYILFMGKSPFSMAHRMCVNTSSCLVLNLWGAMVNNIFWLRHMIWSLADLQVHLCKRNVTHDVGSGRFRKDPQEFVHVCL